MGPVTPTLAQERYDLPDARRIVAINKQRFAAWRQQGSGQSVRQIIAPVGEDGEAGRATQMPRREGRPVAQIQDIAGSERLVTVKLLPVQ